jgi:hypothetical protein
MHGKLSIHEVDSKKMKEKNEPWDSSRLAALWKVCDPECFGFVWSIYIQYTVVDL